MVANESDFTARRIPSYESVNVVRRTELRRLSRARPSPICLWGFSDSAVQWQQEYTCIRIQTRAYIHYTNRTREYVYIRPPGNIINNTRILPATRNQWEVVAGGTTRTLTLALALFWWLGRGWISFVHRWLWFQLL